MRSKSGKEPEWASLLRWFAESRRSLPWRDDPTPYRVWVSEVMLQQTRVATVIPYFDRFIARFPTLDALADAEEQDVLKAWEGLGYYSRGRTLRKAADILRRRGAIPTSKDEWLEIPGVGLYTASAIASIAFGDPAPCVDGNVLRVAARLRGDSRDIRSPAFHADILQWLSAAILRHPPPGDFNQAMMELGALLCVPKSPLCGQCPLSADCAALRQGLISEIPLKTVKKPVPTVQIAVGILIRNGKLLVQRRRTGQMLEGMWEFPGGVPEPGEKLPDALRREFRAETGMAVEVGDALPLTRHAFSHFRIQIHPFLCGSRSRTAKALSAEEVRWVSQAEADALPFPKANRVILERLSADGLLPISTQLG